MEQETQAAGSQTPLGAPDIPGYRVVRQLGEGGQGAVWQAIDERANRKVAIKLIHDAGLANAAAVARFDQERRVLELVEHANLVRIHDSGQLDSGVRWLAMEYISGQTLKAYVNELDKQRSGSNHDFPVREVLQLFIDLCNALHTAHEIGVVHRDIKPGNVVVTNDGRPVLVDFGLAKTEEVASPDAITLTGDFLGSPAYAAPEQVARKPDQIDRRTDIYSLGVTLYEMLTGTFPYPVQGVTFAELHHNIREVDPIPPQENATYIERDLALIILQALRKEPDRRYQTMRAFGDDLQRYLDGRAVSAAGDSAGYQLLKFAQRNRVLVTSVAVAFVLSVGFGGVITQQYFQQVATNTELSKKQNELEAEIQERKLAQAEATVRQGRLAAQRGDWPEAARQFEAGLESEQVDSAEIMLALIEAYDGMQRRKDASELLTELRSDPTAASALPSIMLWEAELLMLEPGGATDGFELMSETLLKGLPRKDQLYAEGLVAPTLSSAILKFDAVLNLSPGHRCGGVHAAMLLFNGEPERAQAQFEALLQLHPDDPNPALLSAIVSATRGRTKDMKRMLDRLSEANPDIEDGGRALTALFVQLNEIWNQQDNGDPENPKPPLHDLMATWVECAAKLGGVTDKWQDPSNRFPRAFSESIGAFMGTLYQSLLFPVMPLESSARDIVNRCQTGPTMWFLGTQLLAAKKYAEAVEVFQEAMVLDGVFDLRQTNTAHYVRAEIRLAAAENTPIGRDHPRREQLVDALADLAEFPLVTAGRTVEYIDLAEQLDAGYLADKFRRLAREKWPEDATFNLSE